MGCHAPSRVSSQPTDQTPHLLSLLHWQIGSLLVTPGKPQRTNSVKLISTWQHILFIFPFWRVSLLFLHPGTFLALVVTLLSTVWLSSYSSSISSVTQSCLTLQPHESQYTRPHCPSSTPGVYSNLCPSSQWYYPAISSSVVPFSYRLQSFPAAGSFPVSQLFAWGGQSIGVSASASVLPMNTPGFISFRMDWLDLLAVQGTFKSLLQHHSSKASIFQCSAFFTVQLSHPYMTTGKTIALTRWTIVGKVMSLLFNVLSRLVITFHTCSQITILYLLFFLHSVHHYLKLFHLFTYFLSLLPKLWVTRRKTFLSLYQFYQDIVDT